VATCRGAGIRVIMVTGDHPRTALAIARRIGLVSGAEPLLLTGEALQRLSATQLQLALDAPEVVFARLAPDQKMRIVEALRAKGEVVAVTGDGVNDAPALKAAHIGIAMGASGSDVAREAADMVLLDDHFASIVHAVEEGRALYANIRKFLTYVLVHNVAELLPYLAFALFGLPVALTPIQALAVDMGTDSLTALGLGVERAAPGTMQRPPRPRGQRLLDLPLALRAYGFLGLIEAGVVMGVFLQVLVDAGWRWPQTLGAQDPVYRSATTAALCALILLQVVNVYLCRSSWRSVLATGLGGNRWIAAGVALELTLLGFFAFTPWGHALLGTAAPPASVWGSIALGAFAMLAAEEARKAWLRRRAIEGVNPASASAR
ncbi:MAG TPA: HAD-IC family P-type ATPase, partial [Burkholderiaceae bacterium]|nr:HAD-IC family P-type ATPase [Burkholderiaceae bacterium]